MKYSVSVFWFRRDLRLHDNHGLMKALQSGLPVLPIFIFDKNILSTLSSKQDARVTFLHNTLSAINDELIKHGSSLCVLYDEPQNAFSKILDQYNVQHVFTNHDYEPYAIKRDAEIEEFLKSKGITFQTFKDQVIFEKDEVLKSDGKPYTIFTPYAIIWKSKLKEQPIKSFASEKLLNNFTKRSFTYPSLSDIGFEKSTINIPVIRIDKAIISNYHNSRNIPSIEGTTRLSVHLRFGTVSTRELVAAAQELNEQWLNELIWREFFMMILFHFPHVVTRSFKPKYDKLVWQNNEKEFDAWCKGETGYPIVDAGMRELNQTGFMHNRVRMIVASFLTKHLLIDWRWGEAYFAEKLLDSELSSNNGNWQWAAGSGCDAAPYFRIFNPAEQTKKFDPQMLYSKKWLGDLKDYTLKPIVEHSFARKRALDTYKQCLMI